MSSGVIVIALPISIVGGAFTEAYEQEKKGQNGDDTFAEDLRNEFQYMRNDLDEFKNVMRHQQNTLEELRKAVQTLSTSEKSSPLQRKEH